MKSDAWSCQLIFILDHITKDKIWHVFWNGKSGIKFI
jgi:hypothetical protein